MVHPANAAPLSEHWKVEPASFEENANDALVLVPLAGGPDVTVVSGGVVSAGGGGGAAHRPGVAGRGRVEIPGGIDRPHLERVAAGGETGVRQRRGAGGERGGVEAALIRERARRRHVVRPAEREGRVPVGRRVRRLAGERGVRSGDVRWRRARRRERQDELRTIARLLTAVELLLVVVRLDRITDEEPVERVRGVGRLQLGGDVPLAPAAAGARGRRCRGRGGLVVPVDRSLRPGRCDRQRLERATGLVGGGVQPQRRRLHDATGRERRHGEPHERPQRVRVLGHDLEVGVGALVARAAALVDPAVGGCRQRGGGPAVGGGRSDRPGERRRRRVLVPGRVDGPDLERVGTDRQTGQVHRRRARRERRRVQGALERRTRLTRQERERRRGRRRRSPAGTPRSSTPAESYPVAAPPSRRTMPASDPGSRPHRWRPQRRCAGRRPDRSGSPATCTAPTPPRPTHTRTSNLPHSTRTRTTPSSPSSTPAATPRSRTPAASSRPWSTRAPPASDRRSQQRRSPGRRRSGRSLRGPGPLPATSRTRTTRSSNEHSNSRSSGSVESSVPVNSNEPLNDTFSPDRPAVIVVSGAVVSVTTVHVAVAGVASALPAMSTARTCRVCSPSSRSLSTSGDTQSPNWSSSRAHSKTAPNSSAEKVNSADVNVVEAGGPATMVVSGAVVSGATMVHS